MNMLFKLILVIKTITNFHLAILDRLGLLKGKVIYRIRRKNLRFIARAGTEDIAEIAVVVSGSEYNLSTISLPSNPVIVDLGGHIGTFSIPLAKAFKNKCKIYSFEPDKDNYQIFLKNISLNKIKSIQTKNIAISDYVGKGYLKTENMNTDAYFLEKSDEKSNCLVSTLPRELSKYRIKKVDLLKMDIEGGEYAIFKHKESMNFIQKHVHYIFIEVDHLYESSRLKKIIDKNFSVTHRQKNVLTLQNTNFESN